MNEYLLDPVVWIGSASSTARNIYKTKSKNTDYKNLLNKFRHKMVHALMYRYYLTENKNDMNWSFSKKDFEIVGYDSEKWESYVEVLLRYKYVIPVVEDTYEVIGEVKGRLLLLFDMYCKAYGEKNIHNKVKFEDDDEEEDDSISIIKTNDGFLLEQNFSLNKFYAHLIDNIDLKEKFIYNKDVEDFNDETQHNIENRKTIIKVVGKTERIQNDSYMALRYGMFCSSCQSEIEFEHYDMQKQSLVHTCADTNIKLSKPDINVVKTLRLYELDIQRISVFKENGKTHTKTTFEKALSFYDLDYGAYEVNMLLFTNTKGYKDKSVSRLIIAYKDYDYDDIEFEIERNQSRHKILDVIDAESKFYKKQYGVNLDNRALSYRIIITFISLMHTMFGHRFFSSALLGDMNISKTYNAEMITRLYDPMAISIKGEKTITEIGIIGGIMNNIFHYGLMSKPFLTVIDEAYNFFGGKSKNMFAEILKNILDGFMTVAKVMYRQLLIRFVPFIISNKIPFHQFSGTTKKDERTYPDEVDNYYKSILAKLSDEETKMFEESKDGHIINAQERLKYLEKQNLFLDESMYGYNEYLLKAISLARKKFLYAFDTDWLTGTTLASYDRVPFLQIVYIEKKERKRNDKTVNIGLISTSGWKKIVGQFLGLDKVRHNFEFYRSRNPRNEEEKKLMRVYDNLFAEAGERIDNDKELKGYIYKMNPDTRLFSFAQEIIMGLTIINDENARRIDNQSYELARNILLKTRRCLTLEEYAFEDHSFQPDVDLYRELYSTQSDYITETKRSEIVDKEERTLLKQEIDKELVGDEEEDDEPEIIN